LFDLVVPEKATSRRFRAVRDEAHFTAARRLMDEMFAKFPDVDKNFIQEFQTDGFSPRVLELAVFAYLQE
jgi:hemoglobin-like flavoprotein